MEKPKCECFDGGLKDRSSDMTNSVSIGTRAAFEDLLRERRACPEAVEYLLVASILNMASVVAAYHFPPDADPASIVKKMREILGRVGPSALEMIEGFDMLMIETEIQRDDGDSVH